MLFRTLLVSSLLCTVAQPAFAAPPPQKAALKAFKGFVKKANKFDVTAYDVIADDAAVSHLFDGQHRMETNGAQFKALAADNIAAAEAMGDIDIFSELTTEETDGGVRITGTRFAPMKCNTDTDFYLDFAEVNGTWTLTAMHTTGSQLSQCPASAAAQTFVTATMDPLRDKLPMAVDEETHWLDVKLDKNNIIYVMHLHTVSGQDQEFLGRLLAALTPQVQANACAVPELKSLVNAGTKLFYLYIGKEQTPIFTLPIGYCK